MFEAAAIAFVKHHPGNIQKFEELLREVINHPTVIEDAKKHKWICSTGDYGINRIEVDKCVIIEYEWVRFDKFPRFIVRFGKTKHAYLNPKMAIRVFIDIINDRRKLEWNKRKYI